MLSCLDFPRKSLLLDSACLNCSEDIHLSLTSPVNLHVKECKARVSHRLRALLSLLCHKREGRKYFEEIFDEGPLKGTVNDSVLSFFCYWKCFSEVDSERPFG